MLRALAIAGRPRRGSRMSGKWVGQIRGQDPSVSGVKDSGSRRKRVKGQLPDVLARPSSTWREAKAE